MRADLPDHLIEGALLRRIDVHRGPRLVVGDVQVEVAVAVHIGQRHGHAAAGGAEPGLDGTLGEHAVAVVDEQRHSPAERADQEVQVAVAVDVGEHGAGRVAAGHRDAGRRGDVLEAPVAQVAVQGIRALVAGEVDVGAAVSIHVPQRHAAALRQVTVPERAVERDGVGESNAGAGREQLGEAGPAPGRYAQRAPAVAGLSLPLRAARRRAAAAIDDQRQAANEQARRETTRLSKRERPQAISQASRLHLH